MFSQNCCTKICYYYTIMPYGRELIPDVLACQERPLRLQAPSSSVGTILYFYHKMCLPRNVLALAALFVGSVHSSWDFAVANGDLLEFYINQTKTDTVRFKSQTLGALAYDEVHNTILYVNKQKDNDTICAFNMSTMQYKYLTERNGRNIRGLAFDPATELLFFTDTKERTINWISLKPGFKNSVYGTTLIKINHGTPTDIAVDSCKGYIYWISADFLRIGRLERN
ncbi:hypothetical protein PYW08_006730 [Mythimna loreyi]|uniref:Uncharacterized protein n=1 Tax=Mythimna loreyi TaxID=667449 RepID=A0ACC2RAG1_9NEOP|nr:hypothetical protein PYW08_006730 [Mythimna loreyi]